jgi:hypothetical protein
MQRTRKQDRAMSTVIANLDAKDSARVRDALAADPELAHGLADILDGLPRHARRALAVSPKQVVQPGDGCLSPDEPHGGREIRTVAFRGDRALVCTTTGGRASFAREDGRWRLAHADMGRC